MGLPDRLTWHGPLHGSTMRIDARCEAAFRAHGADGTPFLVIRRGGKVHHMRNGFDSDAFIQALRS